MKVNLLALLGLLWNLSIQGALENQVCPGMNKYKGETVNIKIFNVVYGTLLCVWSSSMTHSSCIVFVLGNLPIISPKACKDELLGRLVNIMRKNFFIRDSGLFTVACTKTY